MSFIIILQLTPHYMVKSNWTEETNKILAAHWEHLSALNDKGMVKLVGRTNYDVDHEDNRGIAIIEADDMEKAKDILSNDPCILNRVMTGEVHPFTVFMYDGKILNA